MILREGSHEETYRQQLGGSGGKAMTGTAKVSAGRRRGVCGERAGKGRVETDTSRVRESEEVL